MFGKKKEERIYKPEEEDVEYSDNFAIWNWEGDWECNTELFMFLEYMKKKGFIPVGDLAGMTTYIFRKE